MGFFKKLMRPVGAVAPYAGAAIGGFYGGPAGAAAGYSAGSALGGAMNKKKGGGGGPLGMGGGGYQEYQPGPNPADLAMPYLNEVPGTVKPYYDPFIESGRQASGMVNPIYEQMSSSPGAFIENLMRGYSPSRGYQFKQGEMERAMRNAAAHGGFVGTPYNQQQQAETTQGLLGEDMQQFLNNLFGAQERGLRGQENRIQRGYEGSAGLADILGSNLMSKANAAYGGQLQQNQLGADIFANRLNAQNARRTGNQGFMSNLIGSAPALMSMFGNQGGSNQGGGFSNMFGGLFGGGGGAGGMGGGQRMGGGIAPRSPGGSFAPQGSGGQWSNLVRR